MNLFSKVCVLWIFALAGHLLIGSTSATEFAVESTNQGIRINLDGQLFTEYLINSGKKPILWPIIGPTGKPMTRPFPMDRRGAITEAETDHEHHRSFWFSHGNVNGNDLWAERDGSGSTRHRKFVESSGGKTAKLVTINDWLSGDGKKLAEDERTIICSVDGENRVIDFDITIKATEGAVVLGDTKEGTFAVRMPNDVALTANKGGHIVNSQGVRDNEAWGKEAAWVDYFGPIKGEIEGIAILNHPSSYGFPTRWHVRDYGLFAANPFGLRGFLGSSSRKNNVTVQHGDALRLRYRVILHKGNEQQGRIAESFSAYSQQP